MATSERSFRTEIADAFDKKGAFAQAITQRFIAGTPDLLVCYEGEVWFLELKYEPVSVHPLVHLSTLQRVWLHRYQKAGGKAAWVVCSPGPGVSWRMYAGIDHSVTRAAEFDLVQHRRLGVPWDIARLLSHLNRQRGERT